MPVITASAARARLFRLIDEAAETHQPLLITGKRNKAVLISEEDWEAIQETLFSDRNRSKDWWTILPNRIRGVSTSSTGSSTRFWKQNGWSRFCVSGLTTSRFWKKALRTQFLNWNAVPLAQSLRRFATTP